MPKNKSVTISRFFCTECGNEGIPIARKLGKQREAGHLKTLYCIHCQKKRNFAEIRPFGDYNYETFLEEFELGRFINGNKIPIADLMSCTNVDCKYNKNGKCWNSNYSYNCKCRPNKEVDINE